MQQEINRDTLLQFDLWNPPLVSIIITHYNYANYLAGALYSVIDQQYQNWECVVVDDMSDPLEYAKARKIVEEIDDKRIRLFAHDENRGQLQTFFTGLDLTKGDFVCALDPDDRWHMCFLEQAVACHLNNTIYCPILCTEQTLVNDNGALTGVNAYITHASLNPNNQPMEINPYERARLLYFPKWLEGWHWTSTSAMMFRRAACNLMRPAQPLPAVCTGSVDAYIASGAHALGGTLFYTKSLVYRKIHKQNAYMTDRIYALCQDKARQDFKEPDAKFYRDVSIRNILANGRTISIPRKKRTLLQKWKRSFLKRWQKLF